MDGTSGTLDIVPNPTGLDRTHLLMNKFRGGQDDTDYQRVSEKIGEFLQLIRDEDPYAWIRKHHYTKDKLRIERLSRNKYLAMEDCYINLAIVVHQSDKNAGSSEGSSTMQRQLKIETPEYDLIELAKLFDPCHGSATRPTRILIRGRAGVGKTTLCKKIVHDFHSMDRWTDMFKRVLWVPLRKLEQLPDRVYNLESLFFHSLFETHGETAVRGRLARELSTIVEAEGRHGTLFILDGLDEISELLNSNHAAFDFLTQLLNSPNAIITTRPHGIGLAGLKEADLELETIGFLPDQVEDYLRAIFKESPSLMRQVQSFLGDRPLVKSLVRIPIQLDALCSTWDEGTASQRIESMTDLYYAIELKLWKKDTSLQNARTRPMIRQARSEMPLIEFMAFAGLSNEVISFDSTHRDRVYDEYLKHLPEGSKSEQESLPEDKLARVPFLRTSDSSLYNHNTTYHFLHLTYQEYFAAHYFVQRWKVGSDLIRFDRELKRCGEITPGAFLHEHKVDQRYNIFWRFVAGLLKDEGQSHVTRFFDAITQERDSIISERERLQVGFTMTERQWLITHQHQQLLMYCLSEASEDMPQRQQLEDELAEWVLLETQPCQSAQTLRFKMLRWMLCEVEFPVMALCKVLQVTTHSSLKVNILNTRQVLFGLGSSSRITYSVVEALKDPHSWVRPVALGVLLQQPNKSSVTWTAMTQVLRDEDLDARVHASCSHIPTKRRASVPESFWMAWRKLLWDEDPEVASNALASISLLNSTKATWKAIADFLCAANVERVQKTVEGVAKWCTLSSDEWARFLDMLEDDEHSKTRVVVFNSWQPIQTYRSRAEGNWELIERMLAHKDGRTREMAIRKVLNKAAIPREMLAAMPEEILAAIVRLQKDEDVGVSAAAKEAVAYEQPSHNLR